MRSKFLSIMIALTVILGTFNIAVATPIDVAGTDVEEAVDRLSQLDVLTGYPDGTFRPNNNITRAEYAAVVSRAKQLQQEANSNQGVTSFGDVPGSHWASGYINIAEETGLIKGMGIVNGVNTFAPEANITYEQAVTIVVRALGYETVAESNGGYPTGHLAVASQEGLLQDVTGSIGMLATRGLVAQLTYNALEIPNMIKVGSDYIKSGTQGTDEIYLFNELRLINQAAASGNWANIDANTFAKAGITGITSSNIGSFKSTLETLASGTNQNWSPNDIQTVFNNIGQGYKVILAKAINATQIQIHFNTELDSADAITTLPYKVSISGVTFTGTPDLSENGRTLTLTSTAAIDVNNAALVVEPIQIADNTTLQTENTTN